MSRYSRALLFSPPFWAALLFSIPVCAQQPPSDSTPQPSTAPSAPSQALPKTQQKPPEDPAILEDGGISIEPIYWLTRAQPLLRGGATAAVYENLDYPGHSKAALGAEIGIPAGRSNTLRFSYFRLQGNSNTTLGQDSTVFSEAFTAGDYLSSSYRLQNAKISWDYLAYTWYKTKIRFKTLYEMQYITISTNVNAPLLPVTTDVNGNTDTNSATGSKNLFWPTLGGEFEQPIGKHLRWELKGSGFALPHHAVVWDAQADLAFRVGAIEISGGGKAFHFKTSPGAEQYFTDTLSGAYVGVRYYLGARR